MKPFRFEFFFLGNSLFRLEGGEISGGGEEPSQPEYDKSSTTAAMSDGNNERFFGFDHRSNRSIPGDVEA